MLLIHRQTKLLLIAVFAASLFALTATAEAQDAAALLRAGDDLYTQRSTRIEAVQEAVAWWDKSILLDGSHDEPFCKIAQAKYFLGRYSKDAGKLAAMRQSGLSFAARAVAVKPDSACGHYWTAVFLFDDALRADSTASLKRLSVLREHLMKADQVDPAYADGGPARMLARTNYRFPVVRLPEAQAAAEKALKTAPDHPENLLVYAEVLVRRGKYADAKATLERLMKMAARPGEDVELAESKSEASRILETLPK